MGWDIVGALTGGGSAGKASRTLGDARRYAQGLADPYTDIGAANYPLAIQKEKRLLKSDWLGPMRGAQTLALEQAGDAAARGGIAGSGMALDQADSINRQWADQIARAATGVKQAKAQGWSNLAGMTSANALNWADFVNRMRLAEAGNAMDRSQQLTQYPLGYLNFMGQGSQGAGNAIGGLAMMPPV